MRAWSGGEWEDILSRSFVPLATPVIEANFSGSADHRIVGEGVAVTAIRNDACRSERTSRHIAASNDDDVIFAMQRMGVLYASQHGRTAQVTAGCGVLYTTGLPWSLHILDTNESLVIQVPRERLGLSRRLITRLSACTVDSTRAGIAARQQICRRALRRIRRRRQERVRAHRRRPARGPSLADGQRRGRSGQRGRNSPGSPSAAGPGEYPDPRLDVPLLASMLGVSVRTVYSAFATIGLTPAEFIRRQRIEVAAVRLSSSRVSIADIAISVGFSDVTTFARCFKRRYGVTPSQWRGAAR